MLMPWWNLSSGCSNSSRRRNEINLPTQWSRPPQARSRFQTANRKGANPLSKCRRVSYWVRRSECDWQCTCQQPSTKSRFWSKKKWLSFCTGIQIFWYRNEIQQKLENSVLLKFSKPIFQFLIPRIWIQNVDSIWGFQVAISYIGTNPKCEIEWPVVDARRRPPKFKKSKYSKFC